MKEQGHKNKLKTLPEFKNASEEAVFWQDHDSGDYIDWSEAKEASFPNLTPSTKILFRHPNELRK